MSPDSEANLSREEREGWEGRRCLVHDRYPGRIRRVRHVEVEETSKNPPLSRF